MYVVDVAVAVKAIGDPGGSLLRFYKQTLKQLEASLPPL